MMRGLKQALHEPLLQFVLIGGLLFALDALLRTAPPDVIPLPAGMSDRQQQQYVDGQILLREARKRGLERGDSIIQRQLQQKMRNLIETQARIEPANEASLQAWLEQHPERYRQAARIDLEQIFIPRSQQADNPDLSSVLAQLQAAQPITLPVTSLPKTSHAALRKRYGLALADAAFAANAQWSGPVESGLGQHVLRITARHPGALPALQKIRPQVLKDWRSEQRQQAYRDTLQQLRQHYRIQPATAP